MSNSRFNPSDFESADSHWDITPGSFLVASPSLHLTPFQKSVIFILQHNDDGTFGVAVNRPAGNELQHAWDEMTGLDFRERCLVQGGPIGGPIFALHQNRELADLEMPGGLCVSANTETFTELAGDNESEYRIVLGVSGWKTGQLAEELEAGRWFQLDADPEHIFDEPDGMWENFLRECGRQTWGEILGLKQFPEMPEFN